MVPSPRTRHENGGLPPHLIPALDRVLTQPCDSCSICPSLSSQRRKQGCRMERTEVRAVLEPQRSFKSQALEWLGSSTEQMGGGELSQNPSGDHTMMEASLSFFLCQLVPDEWACTRGQRIGQCQVPSSPQPAAIKEPFHAQSPCNLLSFTLLCSGMGCCGEPPGRGCRLGHAASSRLISLLPALGGQSLEGWHFLCRGLPCGSGECVSFRGVHSVPCG